NGEQARRFSSVSPWLRVNSVPSVPSVSSSSLPLAVPDFERDGLAVLLAGNRGQRSERRHRPALPPDHASHGAGIHEQLDERRRTVLRLGDPNLVAGIAKRFRDDLNHRADAHAAIFRRAHFAGSVAAAAALATGGCAGTTVRWRARSVRTESDGCAPCLSQ